MPGKGCKQGDQWFAGFFDGDGCVHIHVEDSKRSKKIQTSLRVSVTNTDPRPIKMFSKRFPGYRGKTIYVKKWVNQNNRIQYEWCIRGLAALEFCKIIYPYSIVKKEQLEVAMEFYSLPWRSQRKTSGGGWKRRTEENIVVDLKYAQKIKELKHAM